MQEAAVDCTDTSAIFDQSCWDALNISDYLGNSTGWVWNVPQCDTKTVRGSSGIGNWMSLLKRFRRLLITCLQDAVFLTKPGQPVFCAMGGMALGLTVLQLMTKTVYGLRMQVQIVCPTHSANHVLAMILTLRQSTHRWIQLNYLGCDM